jgi:hypothetical protein
MIGRGYLRTKPLEPEEGEARGFDAFELRLGDLMRGERATMGKSLIDVQRELKIKAAYIAAIENADPSAFDTPGFIAGYVRSYARYLNMDPDWAFETFCRESGFAPSHGMAPASSGPGPRREEKALGVGLGKDIFAGRPAPYVHQGGGFLANLEPRAVGSVLVLAALLAGLSYGGWFVLREVQKVTFAPVEQPPTVVADLDPLAGGARPQGEGTEAVASLLQPSAEALDRLYRPEALEVPVLVPRDGPIAALDPATVGTLAPSGAGGSLSAGGAGTWSAMAQAGGAEPAAGPTIAAAQGALPPTVTGVEETLAGILGEPAALPGDPAVDPAVDPTGVQVTAGPAPQVQLVAVREAWVRVRAPDGSTLFEGILAPGDTFDVPAFEEAPTLRVGESGGLYMAVNGTPYGPVGPNGAVSNNVPLSAEAILASYQPADPAANQHLADYVAVASAAQAAPAALPAGAVAPGAPSADPVPFE